MGVANSYKQIYEPAAGNQEDGESLDIVITSTVLTVGVGLGVMMIIPYCLMLGLLCCYWLLP